MADITFTILGSSAGMPRPDRVNSGYVLAVGGRLIQIDCGGGVSSAFRRAGFDPLDVERILISHCHPDHVSDLPLYIQMQYLAGRREPITIHLPKEAVEPIRTMFQAMYLIEQKLPFGLSFETVEDGRVIDAGDISIRPVANSHLEKYAPLVAEYGLPNEQQCYSYLIEAGEKKILYSADLGTEKDLFTHLGDVDLLVIESTHIDLPALLEKTIENHVGRVVLTHIAEEFDTEHAVLLAKKAGLGNVQIARDGMVMEV